ncbi:SCAN domain-containing protein 3 [Ditylenchus destructor]|uniref:SCAN domain-containing protein 3 n=1 Tax=Ditylenchus destructor TaxID=166010 RepID=A0AAD4MZS3_9BILA|nr:SCAN domain-containing protein 3 [Ditylenchus destructor]
MDEDFDPVMQAKFNEKLFDLVAQKRFICLPNEATYNSILAALIKIRNGSKIDHHTNEKNYVSRYSMMIANGEEKLFKGNQEVVKQEQAFGILHSLHRRRGHAGRDVMCKKDKTKDLWSNRFCLKAFNSRCQVDLIDLQARPDGDSKFIMVYQGTEFITLDGSKWIEKAENDEPLETSKSPSPSRSRSQSPARSSPSSQASDSITR